VPRFSSASAHFAGAGCGAGAVAGVSLISILAIVRVTTDFFAAALRTLVFAAFFPAARRLRVAAAFLPAAFLFGLMSRHPCLCTICTALEPKVAGVARKTCLLVDGKTTPGLWGRDLSFGGKSKVPGEERWGYLIRRSSVVESALRGTEAHR